MILHWALHPRDNVDRLYASRKEEGRGLGSIEDSIDASIQRLEDYIEKHEGGLITATRNDADNTKTNWMTRTRQQKLEEKQNYGCFEWLISNISHEKIWTWLLKGNLNRLIESLLIAAQNNKIRNNQIKAGIDKIQQNSKCKLRGDKNKTINHIINECSKFSQKEYKTRHEWVGKVIHWELCKEFQFNHTNKW